MPVFTADVELDQSTTDRQYLSVVFFVDSLLGYAVGDVGTIVKTTNSGSTWTVLNSGTKAVLYSVCFVNATTGWATGVGGALVKTTNGGATWTPQSTGTMDSFYSVFFVNDRTGWVGGVSGSIFRTSDGGATWSKQTTNTTDIVISMYFTDENYGCALALGFDATDHSFCSENETRTTFRPRLKGLKLAKTCRALP